MKIYLIEEGSYSDYGIVDVCKTREIAEEYCKLRNSSRNWDQASIAEWEVIDTMPSREMVYVHSGVVSGNTRIQALSNESQFANADIVSVKSSRIIRASSEQSKTRSGNPKPEFYIFVEGTSKSHVDKAFQDRVAQAKAILSGIA